MKRSLLLGAVSVMALIAPAYAANLSAPAPAAPAEYTPPPYPWAGFYIGVNGGYAWNQGGVSASPLEQFYSPNCGGSGYNWCGWNDRGQHSLEGGFGGGQIGFNLQRDRLVYGLEADVQGAGVSSSVDAHPDLYGYGLGHASAQLDWFATIRGRLGIAPYANWLVYITGGVAFGGVQLDGNQNFDYYGHTLTGSGGRNDTFTGYVLGAGLEYGISPAWSVKFEYQFMDLGFARVHETASWNNSTSISEDVESKLSFNTVRVGINYHLVPAYVPLK